MATHALFLRGINLGPSTQLSMSDLRDLVTDLGYDDVRTHLRSGNVVLTASRTSADKLAQRVEAAIKERLGMEVDVVVCTRSQLAAVIEVNPLAAAVSDPARFIVRFLSAKPDTTRLDAVDPTVYEPDRFRVVGRQIYQWCPNGVSKTKLTDAFWKKQALGVEGTARNWNTVTAIMRMLED